MGLKSMVEMLHLLVGTSWTNFQELVAQISIIIMIHSLGETKDMGWVVLDKAKALANDK